MDAGSIKPREVGISSGNQVLTRCAFVGTNPTGELITSGLPVIRRIPQMFAQGSSEEELCVICEGLFVPQRDHGIHTGGAACGNVAGRQRSKREHHGDADISERIAGTYTE